MSNITINVTNAYDTYKYQGIQDITLGDKVTFHIDDTFDSRCVYFRIRISYFYYTDLTTINHTIIVLPSSSEYYTSRDITYTFSEDLVNTDFLNMWGVNLNVSVDAYERVWYPSLQEESYYIRGWAYLIGVVTVDKNKYYPTLTLGTLSADDKMYNNLVLAGINSVACTINLGHAQSNDKATLNTPQYLIKSDDGKENVSKLTYDTENNLITSDTLPLSSTEYNVYIQANVSDSRGVYQDKSYIPIQGITYTGIETHGYVNTNTVTVTPYTYPTYDSINSYVNRCSASGRPDGAGEYVHIHIVPVIATVDGTNVLETLKIKLSNASDYATILNDYMNDGYADCVEKLETYESATIQITMLDSVCTVLGLSNEITSLSASAVNVPLSLFDDGVNQGTAFGQMATKAGNWFYNNLVLVKNSIPYVLDISSNTGIIARKLFGTLGTRTTSVCVVIKEHSDFSYNTLNIYDDPYFTKELTHITFTKGATTTVWLDDIVLGTTLYLSVAGWYPDMGQPVLTLLCNDTTKYEKDGVIMAGGNTIYYQTCLIEENTYIELDLYDNRQTPTNARGTITVRSNGSSSYSFWDDDMVHVSDNGDLTLYVLPATTDDHGQNTVKLHQQSLDYKFLNWTLNGTTYTEDEAKTTGIKCSIGDIIYANYALPSIALTVIPANPSKWGFAITLTDNETSSTLLNMSWNYDLPEAQTINVTKGKSVLITVTGSFNQYLTLIVDGISYTYTYQETGGIVYKNIIINDDTTITLGSYA